MIVTFNTGWDFQDYTDVLNRLKTIALSKNYNIQLFLDFQMTKSVPPNIPSIMRITGKFTIDNIELIVLISPSSVWTKLYRSFQYLLPPIVNVQFASDTDLAYQILQDKAS